MKKKTLEKKILFLENTQKLTTEINQNLTNYFSSHKGNTSRIEIVEQTNTNINLFYSSDENTTSAQLFYQKIADTQKQTFSLLILNKQKELQEANIGQIYSDQHIYAIDALSALFRFLLKTGIQISFDQCDTKQTEKLQGSINSNKT